MPPWVTKMLRSFHLDLRSQICHDSIHFYSLNMVRSQSRISPPLVPFHSSASRYTACKKSWKRFSQINYALETPDTVLKPIRFQFSLGFKVERGLGRVRACEGERKAQPRVCSIPCRAGRGEELQGRAQGPGS